MIDQLEKWIAPFKRRVMLMIGKAVLNTIRDVSGGLPVVQVDLGNGEVIDGVETVQNFGFASMPEKGVQAVVVFVSGNRDQPIVIAADDSRKRPRVDSGDSVQYNSAGAYVKLEGNKAIIQADSIELGSGAVQKLVNETFKTLFNSHSHLVQVAPLPAPPVPSGAPIIPMTDLNLTSKSKAQ